VSVLGLIPARGGSRGIPRKNVRPFLGKPLLLWTVELALASDALDHVVVSTDDEEIAELAGAAGARAVLRPAELAGDATPTAPVGAHALATLAAEGLEPATVAILEPTSPGRRPAHVTEGLALLAGSGADSVASVSLVPHHFVAEKQLALAADGAIAGLDGTPVAAMTHRRQDLPERYAFDGILFACRAELLRLDPPTLWGPRTLGYAVDRRFAIDLDDLEDWLPAEARLRAILEDGS
jgi:CMP-N-acetylneuraminic acid synthetase